MLSGKTQSPGYENHHLFYQEYVSRDLFYNWERKA
jgi:hypothetical protein